MKYGREVEGRLKGLPTIFCDASEPFTLVKSNPWYNETGHIYVSDQDNTLDYTYLSRCFEGKLITLDVTDVRDEARPANVTIMLRDPTFDQLALLLPTDQIKFERDRTVFVFSVNTAEKTYPADFEGDIEI